MAEVKRVTLHPVLEDGSIDTNVNLYPKTLLDGIVNRQGEPVDVALKSDISNLEDRKVDKEEGKGLSSNDFTDEEKEKLDNLNGGTKLYRHRISVGLPAEEIYIISSQSSSYQLGELNETFVGIDFICGYDQSNAEAPFFRVNSTVDTLTLTYYDGQSSTISGADAFIDTVTPLTNEETPIK